MLVHPRQRRQQAAANEGFGAAADNCDGTVHVVVLLPTTLVVQQTTSVLLQMVLLLQQTTLVLLQIVLLLLPTTLVL